MPYTHTQAYMCAYTCSGNTSPGVHTKPFASRTHTTGYLTYDDVLHTYHQLDALRPTLLPTVFSETTDRLRAISPRVSRLDPQRFLIINRPATHMLGAPAPLPAAALFPIRQVMCVHICVYAASNYGPPRRCFPFVRYACMHVCTYVRMYVRTYVCTYACMYVRM